MSCILGKIYREQIYTKECLVIKLHECFGCTEDVGLLFSLERDAEMSEKYSSFGMKLVETNGEDWIKQCEPRYLFGIKH